MTDTGLSPQQIQVIDALSSGATMTQAAELAGIHRNTLFNWRRNHLPFQHALAQAQDDRALLYREKTEELAELAIETIRAILTDPKASPSVRLRAALSILNTISKPRHDFEQAVAPDGPAPHVDMTKQAQAEIDAYLAQLKTHNSAQRQTVQTIRRDHPKVGRNESCPCGSGLKYKRCCDGKPLAAAA